MLKVSHNDTIHTFYKKVQDESNGSIKTSFPVTTTFHLRSKSSYQQIRCKYTKHPNITCSTIYDYLHLIDAPECFDITSGFISSGYKDNKKAFHNCLSSSSPPATISALEQVQEILYTTTVDVEESSNDLSFPPTTTDDDLPPQYAALIAAFCQSNTIICDACGSKGHHASKCFKRGIEFLPRDVQRQIAAYNAKYGTTPNTDSSPDPHKSCHSLPTPDHCPPTLTSPQETPTQSTPSPQPQVPTISSLNHVLPSPFSPPQEKYTLRNSHHQALYHLNDTAPFHISNNCSDFIRFYPHRSSISLRNYLPLSCKGTGTIITRTPNSKHQSISVPLQPQVSSHPLH